MSKFEFAQEAQVHRAQEALRKIGLTYQAMSDTYGINLGQLKKFMSGRLKKIPPEIESVLVSQLNISPPWLIEGVGPMLKTDLSLSKIRSATNTAVEVALHYSPLSQSLISDMQAAAYAEGLSKDQLMERFHSRLPTSTPTARELALLDNYRLVSEETKRAIEQFAGLAAQSVKTASSPSPNAETNEAPQKYTVDFGGANIGQAIAGNITNNKFKNKQNK